MSGFRVGIIGMGKMGSLHRAAWNRLPGAAVVATIDHAGRVADLIGHVDICVVSTPTPNHVATALELISAGVHCLVEKPLAPTEREARVVAETAAQRGVVLGVGHTERFNPNVVMARTLLRTAASADGICLADIRRNVDASPHASSDVVLDLMVHDIDWVLHGLGEMPEDVELTEAHGVAGTWSAVGCELRFSRGRTVQLSANHAAGTRSREAVILPQSAERVVVNLAGPATWDTDDPVTRQARSFLAALAGERSDLATGWDAVRTAAVADLIHGRIREEARW